MTNISNGVATLQYLLRHRPSGAAAWTVPRWLSPISAGVFPIGVTAEDRYFPIGTAFTISRLGIVASALHNIRAAFEYHRNGGSLRTRRELPENYTLDDIGLAIFHSWVRDQDRVEVTVWQMESCNGAPPTDLLFGFPVAQPELPKLALPLSFAVPRVGAKLYCVGYGEMAYPEAGISLTDIRAGAAEWVTQSALDLRVVEGRVSKILLRGVTSSLGNTSGHFFFVWTLIAVGVTTLFSVILSVRGLWSLRRGQSR